MKIIQPEAHILPFSGDVLKHVERCGRIAYKSEDAITEDSHVKFIQHLIQRGHESVLEHGNYVLEIEDVEQFNDVMHYYLLLNTMYSGAHADKGYVPRLRFSSNGKNIVSGNIRGWRNFIRCLQMTARNVPAIVVATFRDNPAFADLKYGSGMLTNEEYFKIIDEKGIKPAKILSRDDLTPEEQYIHWTETALFTCDRSISHELVRHRALSPIQESQRYCNYSKGKFGGEVTFIQPEYFPNADGKIGLMPEATEIWYNTMMANEKMYLYLLQMGMKPQQARKVLNNSTKTEVALTGTIGEWIHFFNLRCAEDADSEMRRLAKPLRTEFNVHYTV